ETQTLSKDACTHLPPRDRVSSTVNGRPTMKWGPMTAPEILSALTTPFTSEGEVDADAFRANLDRLAPLVDGVFVAGTTGEYPALTTAEHAGLVAQCLEVFGPRRVVVHVGAA